MLTDVSDHHTSYTQKTCHVLASLCCTLKMAVWWPTETLPVSSHPQSRQLSQLSCSMTAIPVHQARPHCCIVVLFFRQLHADDDCIAPPIHHRRQRSWQWFSEGEDSAGRHGEHGAAHNEPTARAGRHGYVRHRASNTPCCLCHFLAFLIVLSVPSFSFLFPQYAFCFFAKPPPPPPPPPPQISLCVWYWSQ